MDRLSITQRLACRLLAPDAGMATDADIDREAQRLFGEAFADLTGTEVLRFAAWLAARAVRLAESGGEDGR